MDPFQQRSEDPQDHFSPTFRGSSFTFSQTFRGSSGTFSPTFRGSSGTFSPTFRGSLRTFSPTFRGSSGTCYSKHYTPITFTLKIFLYLTSGQSSPQTSGPLPQPFN
jgi:hypothetical protein